MGLIIHVAINGTPHASLQIAKGYFRNLSWINTVTIQIVLSIIVSSQMLRRLISINVSTGLRRSLYTACKRQLQKCVLSQLLSSGTCMPV
jgi:hypothetical protein